MRNKNQKPAERRVFDWESVTDFQKLVNVREIRGSKEKKYDLYKNTVSIFATMLTKKFPKFTSF